MKIALEKIQLMILRLLVTQAPTMFAGSITEKYGISYKELVRSLKEMEGDGFISIEGANISITRLGRKWALENQEKFKNGRQREYTETPEKFKGPLRTPGTPYAPRLSKLDKYFFSLHAEADD